MTGCLMLLHGTNPVPGHPLAGDKVARHRRQ